MLTRQKVSVAALYVNVLIQLHPICQAFSMKHQILRCYVTSSKQVRFIWNFSEVLGAFVMF